MGLLAGIVGTLALSALARIMPGMQFGKPGGHRPENGQSEHDEAGHRSDLASQATPAQALTEPQAPGPEGLAQQFAFKFASGLFAMDISRSSQMWGMAVHLGYGSGWGALLGLILGTFSWPASWSGLAFGMLVWLVGPALLVPAMRILPPLPHQGTRRLALLVAGHAAWGLVVAHTFRFLERRLL